MFVERVKTLATIFLSLSIKCFYLFFYILYISNTNRNRSFKKISNFFIIFIVILLVAWKYREWLTNNKEFIEFVMAFTLIFVTATYVYLTNKLVNYQSELQLSEHQPLIYSELTRTNLPGYMASVEEFGKELTFKLLITNIGKGSIIDLKLTYRRRLLFSDKPEFAETTKTISSILESEKAVSTDIDLSDSLDAYKKIPKMHSIPDFLYIDYIFHDVNRNFFLYKQEFSFFNATIVQYQCLHLEKESLWRIPAQKLFAMNGTSASIIASEHKPLFVRGRKEPLYKKMKNIMNGRF